MKNKVKKRITLYGPCEHFNLAIRYLLFHLKDVTVVETPGLYINGDYYIEATNAVINALTIILNDSTNDFGIEDVTIDYDKIADMGKEK